MSNNNLKVVIVSLIIGLLSGSLSGALTVSLISSGDDAVSVSSKKIVIEESDYVSAIEKVSPSVVSVVASKDLQSFLVQPFGPFGVQVPQEGVSEYREVGAGTGFVVSEDGLVVTNKHVVSDLEADYTVIFDDGSTYYADVLSRDPSNDLAVMRIFEDEDKKVQVTGLRPVEFGDSDSLVVGSRVLAVGNALSEFQNTTTLGIISGKGRHIVASGGGNSSSLNGLLQTDAAINPGNSGGPLVNSLGQVIGVNTAVAQSADGIGFAIPINDVKPVVSSVIEFGEIVRPYLGIRYTELNPQIAKSIGLEAEYGAYIAPSEEVGSESVLSGSPAFESGLVEGDVIVSLDGEAINEERSLVSLLRDYKPGDKVELDVLRDGSEIQIEVELGKFES